MRIGYIIDTLTSVDFQEKLKIGEKEIRIYEGVIHQGNFKISPFRKGIEKWINLGQKYKDNGNDLMQILVKLVMNSIYREFKYAKKKMILIFLNQINAWKQELMKLFSEDWKLPIGIYIVKTEKDDGLDDDCDIKNTLHDHLGAFILSSSERIRNNFIRESSGF